MLKLSILASLGCLAAADIYMHNPRGSNNRWRTDDEDDNNVDNNNRLFDSQNNNDGGYDASLGTTPQNPATTEPMRYFEGSRLTVQWASQHACGKDSWINCEYVLQYKCGADVGDGDSNDDLTFNGGDGTGDDVGYHETWSNYRRCQVRERNRGLFVADREEGTDNNLNANNEITAIYTRQNNNNGRDGFECAEERDYYPYWMPSEWIDIAILTDDITRCPLYHGATQNTNEKKECLKTTDTFIGPVGHELPGTMKYITKAECDAAAAADQDSRGITWAAPQEAQRKSPWFSSREDNMAAGAAAETALAGNAAAVNRPFWGAHTFAGRRDCQHVQDTVADKTEADRLCAGMLNGPECLETTFARDNHLGTVTGGFLANYTWKLPRNDNPEHKCVLRIRYNMSSDDYDGWTTDAASNYPNTPVEQDPYEFYNWKSQPISLALNTNQYGRTFQDRSHAFKIIKRSTFSVPDNAEVYNINVRGKRGHITQAYPSYTYDFVPQFLHIRQGDYVHFQWEGSSTVRIQYHGGGRDRTERHNVVQIKDFKSNYPLPPAEVDMFGSDGSAAVRDRVALFATAGQINDNACRTLEALLAQHSYSDEDSESERWEALMKVRNDPNNCAALNRAPETFWSTPFPMTQLGSFYYMSTRDNFPGLQSAKAAIYVSP